MALVPHKYMPQEMPEPELRETFAARQHTLDYLIQSLRAQVRSSTLTSFLITGPRGAGKTTIVLRLAGEIKTDPALAAAWLSVRFPEELPGIESLRDLLAAALRLLADKRIASAIEHIDRVEQERDDDRSLGLAVAGLKQVAQEHKRRLVLFVENLDIVFSSGIDKPTQHTLRRLLMVDPFMMIVGTAVTFGSFVRNFSAIQKYDHALFNYFCPVSLDRLNGSQVHELLWRRADFDRNERFKLDYKRHKAKIQAISHLTGGNPRLLLMLYEVLSARDMNSIVQTLRQLIDELTPLLKSIVESLPPQQAKVIDALMRAGGSATPRDLVSSTRLSLNAVTTQLGRLKDAQMVEVRGGGKGRPAHYTIPDRLFSTWYQMRYLRPHRRRIELFVEVLRTWFEAEERLNRLQSLASDTKKDGLLDCAVTSEYLAASLKETPFGEAARDLAVRSWLRTGNLREAALFLAELQDVSVTDRSRYEITAYAHLSRWSDDYTATMQLPNAPAEQVAMALVNRGVEKRRAGDTAGAIADFTAVVPLLGAPREQVAKALFNRSLAKGETGDAAGATEDLTAVVQLPGAPVALVATALFNRGVARRLAGDGSGAIEDYSAIVDLQGASAKQQLSALFNRALAKGVAGDTVGAIEDYISVARDDAGPAQVRGSAGAMSFILASLSDNRRLVESAVNTVVIALQAAAMDAEDRQTFLLTFLNDAATAEMRAAWPRSWRAMSAAGLADVSETLQFFEPVVRLLEGTDSSILNELPPEQREFVEHVLQRFDHSSAPSNK